MPRYCITHTDEYGEQNQLTGAWEAKDPRDAIEQMMREAGCDDDGKWLAHLVKDEGDIIP